MNKDTVLIGKFRRPGHPGADVSYDPSHGIRVAGEDVPASPAGAAAWCKNAGGWVRFRNGIGQTGRECAPVGDFIKEYRRAR